MKKIFCIVGPTGIGKTDVSIELAKKINGEIIIADSRQIYKYLDIGTAKPTKEQQEQIPHHLLNIIEPDNNTFSVYDFKILAERAIDDIISRGKIPIMVGGTGFYIKAVIDNLSLSSVPANPVIRKKLKEESEIYGVDYLYQKLKEVDKISSEKISPHDLKRIIRALEVYYQTGNPISHFHKSILQPQKYNTKIFGLNLQRETLYERIEKRVDEMINLGLLNEVKNLLDKGYSENLNSLQGIGYKQIIGYLKNKYSLNEAIELLKRDTRRYAKRQIIWFRKDKRIFWIDIDNMNLDEIVDKIISLAF